MCPIAGLELVLNQPVCSLCIRDAQQRLGQNHQREAFLCGKGINVQEVFNTAEAAGACAYCLNEMPGTTVDASLSLG